MLTTLKAVKLQTFVNIAIRKNEFTHTIKQIKKIAGLPSVKNPISKREDGLFGQTSLAFKYKTEHITT